MMPRPNSFPAGATPRLRARASSVSIRQRNAVRYVVEVMPPAWLNGTILEVDEHRYDGKDIQALYDAPDYPLEREKAAA